MNLSGTLNAFRLLRTPALCIPQLTVPSFDKIPIPLTKKLWPAIKAVVLDKDNCFSTKHGTSVYEPYREHFELLKQTYPGNRLLIVSNRAGTGRHMQEADVVEEATGIKVLRHSTKKPGCGIDILKFFRSNPEAGVTKPTDIAVVGDRLLTDIMLANLMGALGVWVQDGVEPQTGTLDRLEKSLPTFLSKLSFQAPAP